jgi:hypothetical protein
MATIERELLTGNINLTLKVYGTPEECDHPVRFKITLKPERLAQIRRMAAIVKEHRSIDGLHLSSVKGWDYYGDWLNGAWDTDDGELTLDENEPERMECCAIVVSDDDLYFEGIVKHTDIRCETDLVFLSQLNAENGIGVEPPTQGRYTTEGGNRDERLRTTD